MKSKDIKELHQKSVEELTKLLSETKTKLFSHKMEKEQGKLTDLRMMSKTRDDIAVILTILRSKQEGGKHA